MSTIIDPAGDVTIRLITTDSSDSEQKLTTVQVSSKCLSLASPVFAAMLRPTFLEGSQLHDTGSVTIDLEDDPKAMLIILQALHLRGREVPEKTPDIDTLLNMALIVDKYDLRAALLSWIGSWLLQDRYNMYFPENTEWLAISYLFGDERGFKVITEALINTCMLDEEGMLVGFDGKRLFSEVHPSSTVRCPCQFPRAKSYLPDLLAPISVMDALKKERKRMIKNFYNHLQSHIKVHEEKKDRGCSMTRLLRHHDLTTLINSTFRNAESFVYPGVGSKGLMINHIEIEGY
ncbi:hypothetical protein K440DRAFT_642325 [Wilcoxina mikolae CBS 423.85]|nr:hypothetical protein K440DRAFT_642325 [Wilcoxina mikolae CBS 423.85]